MALTIPPQVQPDAKNEVKIAKTETAEPSTRRNPVTKRLAVRFTHKQNRTVAKTLENRTETVALTSEEKYAYGQLMLALSITSSKLKLVKDTINRIEEGKPAGAPNDR